MKPTAKERNLLKEMERIRAIAYRYAGNERATRVKTLKIERDALIRTRVLLDCLMIEEAMSLIIMDYVLQDSPKWKSIKYFGRIKKYRLLYEKVLAHIPPFQKLNTVKDILKIPRRIEKTMRRIFSLRNVLAHVFTIDYTREDDVDYAGRSIFDLDNFENYVEEANEAVVYLIAKLRL